VKEKPLVAILIRQTKQRLEALETGQALLKSGFAVIFFCLGNDSMTQQSPPADELQCFMDLEAECYANSPHSGLPFLPLAGMAERLKQCDLVIPF